MDEKERQSVKEEAVTLALKQGMALIRRDLEIHGMKADGSTKFISRSQDYDKLWEDARKALSILPQPMKKNVLSIEINAPIEKIFEFTCNPQNTSKWVPDIIEETIDTPTTTVGSIYHQKWKDGKETAMIITGLISNKQLDFHSVNGTYTCMYKYEKIPNGTRLTYSEENGVDGEIDAPFSKDYLTKLKQIIEKNN